jgi:hypothetical protein
VIFKNIIIIKTKNIVKRKKKRFVRVDGEERLRDGEGGVTTGSGGRGG